MCPRRLLSTGMPGRWAGGQEPGDDDLLGGDDPSTLTFQPAAVGLADEGTSPGRKVTLFFF